MPEKSVREMNKFEKLHYSLASRTFHAALRGSIIIGVVALLIGLGMYGYSLTKQYISDGFNLAKSAEAVATQVVDPGEFTKNAMNIYYDAIDKGIDDPESPEYLALFDEIRNDTDYQLFLSILRDFNDSSDVNDIYFAMYDNKNGKIVIIADPDNGATVLSSIGSFEDVSDKEINKFMNWNGKDMLFHVSHTKSYGWLCTSGVPYYDENGEIAGFFLADATLGNVFRGIRMFLLQYTIAMFIVVNIIAIVLANKMKKRLAEPINKIAVAAEEYVKDKQNGISGAGHFAPLNITTGDEIEGLSLTLKDMERDLADYESDLTRIVAEKERLGTELALATRIQSEMLPNIYPAFPERSEFDIFATMTPAKEVGGDFYDFFLIDDDHLGLVIADVSGKGVPAALFMMASRIMIQNTALTGKPPAEILETVNNQICGNNPEEMFVTVWLGVLEISTGTLRAANAGHEYPAVSLNGGAFELYKDKHGFVIGGMKGVNYKNYELKLSPGDMLFVYTDGVTEATDAERNLFGTDRMLEALNSSDSRRTTEALKAVGNAVDAFVSGSPQFDDMTMLCLKYNGGSTGDVDDDESNGNNCAGGNGGGGGDSDNGDDGNDGSGDGSESEGPAPEITVPALTESIDAVTDFVNGELEKYDCPMKAQMQIDVAIDEIFSNIAKFAYTDGQGMATVSVRRTDEPSGVEITFYDSGRPFDPLNQEDPDVTLGADERQAGGLGVFIVKKTMDSAKYEYKNGKNVLKIKKYF